MNSNLFQPRHSFVFLLGMTLALNALTLEENLTFDAQGGCSVTFIYIIPNESVGILNAMHHHLDAQMTPPLATAVTDEAAVRAQFASTPGVAVESYFIFKRPDARTVQFTVSARNAHAALQSGVFGNYVLQPSPKVIGDLEFSAQLPKPAKPWTAESRDRARQLTAMLGGWKLILRLITPTEILETTGKREDFNRTSWRFTETELLQDTLPAIHARW